MAGFTASQSLTHHRLTHMHAGPPPVCHPVSVHSSPRRVESMCVCVCASESAGEGESSSPFALIVAPPYSPFLKSPPSLGHSLAPMFPLIPL